jgi:hypothetical protein
MKATVCSCRHSRSHGSSHPHSHSHSHSSPTPTPTAPVACRRQHAMKATALYTHSGGAPARMALPSPAHTARNTLRLWVWIGPGRRCARCEGNGIIHARRRHTRRTRCTPEHCAISRQLSAVEKERRTLVAAAASSRPCARPFDNGMESE